MQAELSKTFRFDAGHHLPNVPPGHKCAGPHGHSYKLTIVVVGEVDAHTGWVMDFGRIKAVVGPLIDRLDHATLNDVEGLGNPTSELIARWFWDRIRPEIPELSAVVIQETETSSCTYRGAGA
jgi:6-pyruvoyltetrahydropterin/6-carboxytetrahydropterin synthase